MCATDGPSTSLNLFRMISNPENSSVRNAGWTRFFVIYGPVITAWSRIHGPDHHAAEEISANVWAALARALPGFVYDPTRSFRAYLWTSVKNAARMFLKSLKRHRDKGSGDPNTHEMLEHVPSLSDRDGLIGEISESLRSDLERVVASVRARLKTPKSWEAFYRTRIVGEEARRVAKDLGMKPGAVYRAANRVQKLIKEEVALLSGRPSDCPGGIS